LRAPRGGGGHVPCPPAARVPPRPGLRPFGAGAEPLPLSGAMLTGIGAAEWSIFFPTNLLSSPEGLIPFAGGPPNARRSTSGRPLALNYHAFCPLLWGFRPAAPLPSALRESSERRALGAAPSRRVSFLGTDGRASFTSEEHATGHPTHRSRIRTCPLDRRPPGVVPRSARTWAVSAGPCEA